VIRRTDTPNRPFTGRGLYRRCRASSSTSVASRVHRPSWWHGRGAAAGGPLRRRAAAVRRDAPRATSPGARHRAHVTGRTSPGARHRAHVCRAGQHGTQPAGTAAPTQRTNRPRSSAELAWGAHVPAVLVGRSCPPSPAAFTGVPCRWHRIGARRRRRRCDARRRLRPRSALADHTHATQVQGCLTSSCAIAATQPLAAPCVDGRDAWCDVRRGDGAFMRDFGSRPRQLRFRGDFDKLARSWPGREQACKGFFAFRR
jgi:hypothetical protein